MMSSFACTTGLFIAIFRGETGFEPSRTGFWGKTGDPEESVLAPEYCLLIDLRDSRCLSSDL